MNFSDTIQHWLQGQINAAVDGHSARLERLEAAVTHAQCQDERIKRLEAQVFELNERLLTFQERYPDFPGLSSHVEHMSEHVSTISNRLDKLEKAYPDMATTKDLLKDTRPEVLMDKLQPLIEQVIRNELEGCVKHCELEETVTKFLGYRKPINVNNTLDAQRYRWLREQCWSNDVVSVVPRPKSLPTGTQTYSRFLLDQFIDKEMAKGEKA